MTKPNRSELVSRITQKVEDLQAERATLLDRLRLVEGLLREYQELLAPQAASSAARITVNVGTRTAARQERKAAMIAFLKMREEAQTGEIIDAMKEALPHANPTRAQVQDVLQNEIEFASTKKGVWSLSVDARVAVKPSFTAGSGIVKQPGIRAPEQEQALKELLG